MAVSKGYAHHETGEKGENMKTYYTVTYGVWGADGPATATFGNKADADKFYDSGDHRDPPVAHRVSRPETIARYDEDVAMTSCYELD
jgi:hypothetical protein